MSERSRLLHCIATVQAEFNLPANLLRQLDLPGLRLLARLARLRRRERWLRSVCAAGAVRESRRELQLLLAEEAALVEGVAELG